MIVIFCKTFFLVFLRGVTDLTLLQSFCLLVFDPINVWMLYNRRRWIVFVVWLVHVNYSTVQRLYTWICMRMRLFIVWCSIGYHRDCISLHVMRHNTCTHVEIVHKQFVSTLDDFASPGVLIAVCSVVAFARAAVIGWHVSPCEPPSHCSQVRNCTSHSIKALACYCCALAPLMLL